MGVLELCGGEVLEATVQAPVVPPVDPACGSPFDINNVAVGPVVEHGGADALGLEQPDHRLHERVVICIRDCPNGRADALEVEVLGERDGRVLTARVRMTYQLTPLDGVAIRSGTMTSSTSLQVAACQATIFCANTSTMNDT